MVTLPSFGAPSASPCKARMRTAVNSPCPSDANSEANCSSGKPTSLIGRVSINNSETLYSIYGDWFGLVIVISAILFILLPMATRRKL